MHLFRKSTPRLMNLMALIVVVAVLAACGGNAEPTPTPIPAVAPPADTATPAPAEPTEDVAASATDEAATDEAAVDEAAVEEEAASEEATPEASTVEASTDVTSTGELTSTEEVTTTDASTETAAAASGERAGDVEPAERLDMYSEPFEQNLDEDVVYYATIKTTKGDIEVQLFADRAPVTVNNFVNLAREGYYDNTTFHRVLEDFMAQAGDPSGTGMGGPGYTIVDEFVPGLNFDRPGLLAMANTGAPQSGGSQWFLTFAPTEWLNQMHTIFGEVIGEDSLEVLSSLSMRDPVTATEPGDTILTIEIEERDESVLPTPTPLPPTPTPFAPSSLDAEDRPLSELEPAQKVGYFSAEPEMTIDTDLNYTATIVTTAGDLVVTLSTAEAPVAVNNFVTLANLGFYDNTRINQVNPGTLLVIGSPDNTLPNDVGYLFTPETNLTTEPATGSIAFAPLMPQPDGTIQASGSILLVALAAPPAEAGVDYGFFGTVTEEGLEILTALTAEDTIETITITESE